MSVSYNPAALFKGARATFIESLAAQPPSFVDRVCTYVSSESADEDYAWIGESAQMSKIVDELQFNPLSDARYTLTNATYGSGVQFKRTDITNQKNAAISGRIQGLAETAARHPDQLISEALINGTSATLGLCYDGGAFFTATHPARGQQTATQSNLLTGNGTTTANCATDIGLAVAALMGFKGENNEPINSGMSRFFIMVPSDGTIIKSTKEAIGASIISNTSNVQLSGMVWDYIVNPRLNSDSATDYYIGIQDAALRGLIFQDRQPLTLEDQEGSASDVAFVKEIYRYKARAERAVGYGRWQRLVKINNA